MNGPSSSFWLSDPASTSAAQIDAGWSLALWISAVALLLLILAMTFLVFRFKRRSETEVPPAPARLLRVEVVWTLVPIAIVAVLFLAGFKGFIDQEIAPVNSLEVSATAAKGAWTFDYANGAQAVDALRVPVGRPVRLTLASKDAIQGFYVPELRVKKDAVPGATTSLWFEPTREGTLSLRCTGDCGSGNAAPDGKVTIMAAREFDDWLEANGSKLSPELQGAQLATKLACATCHTVDGKPGVGPTWKGLAGSKVELSDGTTVTVDDTYLRESITDPNAKVVKGFAPVMPVFKGLVTQAQIDALIAYIKSLK